MEWINNLKMTDIYMALALIIILAIIIFLIIREVLCWYWKINENISVLKSTQAKTEKQLNIIIELLQEVVMGDEVYTEEDDGEIAIYSEVEYRSEQ